MPPSRGGHEVKTSWILSVPVHNPQSHWNPGSSHRSAGLGPLRHRDLLRHRSPGMFKWRSVQHGQPRLLCTEQHKETTVSPLSPVTATEIPNKLPQSAHGHIRRGGASSALLQPDHCSSPGFISINIYTNIKFYHTLCPEGSSPHQESVRAQPCRGQLWLEQGRHGAAPRESCRDCRRGWHPPSGAHSPGGPEFGKISPKRGSRSATGKTPSLVSTLRAFWGSWGVERCSQR